MSLAFALLIVAALVALACAPIAARRARRIVPRGRVVYSDADGKARPLVSPLRPLSGKPDSILQLRNGARVPVEFKSYAAGARPPHPDLVQLGAYLVLLEDLHGEAPPYGVLRYRNRAMRVPYTPALRAEVLRALDATQRRHDAPPAGTPRPGICRTCPFQPICEVAAR